MPAVTGNRWEWPCFSWGRQVEFPEARIYEETLNILLYESQDGRGPDNALLEATGGAAGRSHHLDEDEERERIERVRRIHIKRPDDRAHLHQWAKRQQQTAQLCLGGAALRLIDYLQQRTRRFNFCSSKSVNYVL